EALASSFAEYEPVIVNVDPQVPAIDVAEDFSNVNNFDQVSYLLSGTNQKTQLLDEGFIVEPGWSDEFFSVYEQNRYNYRPSFVTVDSLLHNYHLLFDHLLRQTEEGYLIENLKSLNAAMLNISQEQYETLKNTDWANAAKRNVGLFAVSSRLLDPTVEIPSIVKTEVEGELKLIEDKAGIENAILVNLGREEGVGLTNPTDVKMPSVLLEDYSQYIPRGHYDRTEELEKYFKSMMWLGRMTYRFSNADEAASAILITQALSDSDISSLWQSIYEPTNFFVGQSDDITYQELEPLIDDEYGAVSAVSELAGNSSAFLDLFVAIQKISPPKINSIPVFQASIEPDRDAQIIGFRFMGQRFTLDASIFQRLICSDVGNKRETIDCGGSVPDSRMVPNGLDIPAAFGSDEAYTILDDLGETEYYRYPENMDLLKKYIVGLDQTIWTQNLYWGWLYAIKPLTEPVDEGYPEFMQNQSWVRKDLQSFLGSWAELKHDTILYAKQAYAELGGGPIPEYDDRGYVEPRPEVFGRLASLTKMTREGLELRGLISESMSENLTLMETLATSLKTISEKELNNESRTEDEYELIRSYGGQLEHFWLEVNKADMESAGKTADQFLTDNPAAVIADVATDPNGDVLEVGVGKVDNIYVLVEVEGVIKIAKGGVFSYYEFPWPLNDRLTDDKWRELLVSDEVPERPDWQEMFLSQTE
ncbi:DUF3160 domain-containing protein, partial [Patescibacteria group bacterium]|nr:DUF3160 domain-containing protein [Patescibacteria group bacterium]